MAQPTGVFFQYRADEAAATYTTTVAGVADTSGNARPNIVPASSTVRPALTTGGAGGHSYLTFDGVDDRLTTNNTTDPSMLAFGNAKSGLTLSAVVRLTAASATTTRYIAHFSTSGSTAVRFGMYADQTGFWAMQGRRLDTDTAVTLTSTTALDTALHLLVAVGDYANATQRFYLDGQLIGQQAAWTAGTSSATNSNTWNLGANATPALFYGGELYEVLGYDRALTATEVGQLWSYEQSRYAIPGGAAVTPTATRVRVLRAAVATSGAATLRVLSATVSTQTGVQANAGLDQSVRSTDLVQLSGLASSGGPTSYAWTQTAGPAVSLAPSGAVSQPAFKAPATDAGATLTFSLTVAAGGAPSTPATTSVTVAPHVEWAYLAGAWTPVITEASLTLPPTPVSPVDVSVLADDPVAYFPLDAVGDTLDANGGPLVASPHGIVRATALPNGDPAVAFDGSSSYFEVPDDPSLSGATSGALTLEAWVRPDVLDFTTTEGSTAAPYVYFAGKGASGQHEYAARMYSAHAEDGVTASTAPNRVAGYVFNLSGGIAPGVKWQGGVANTDGGTPPVMTAGSWFHYALVVDTVTLDANGDGSLKLYRNGVLVDHIPTTGIVLGNGSAPLRIGTRDLNSFFQGAVGKVALYDRALPASRLLAHVRAMTGTFPA